MTLDDLVRRAFEVFRDDLASPPPVTLRGGSEIDGYGRPDPYDPSRDAPTDEYVERFAYWGLGYLDAQSWRHYLPRLIEYSLSHPEDAAMVAEALVRSLRPPDRYPPRLASLTGEQEQVVTRFLEAVALDSRVPGLEEDAQQALEEWWLPNPRNRPAIEEIVAARARPVTYRTAGAAPYRLMVPDTLSGSGVRDIPEESRRVETWGGYVCHDAHTVIAVNVSPLAARSRAEAIRSMRGRFRDPVEPADVAVPGSRRAQRLEGLTHGDSPVEPMALTLVVAETGDELVMLSIRTWPRDDVRRVVARIAASFGIVAP
jgi:hypothetical protein